MQLHNPRQHLQPNHLPIHRFHRLLHPFPPTPSPNIYAEKILTAFSEAIQNREFEEARTYFIEESVVKSSAGYTYEGLDGVDTWLQMAENNKEIYKFSEFSVNGDNAEFKWIVIDKGGQWYCKGIATMEKDKIIYLEIRNCN